ncbi:MAG: N-acetyltransferase [Phycisphaeraceae bacterium]|nr:MAG: N-acetyltransferase [Phycisphaeraceae bacterium]
MIRVRRIPMDDPLFAQAVDLRERVLLGPVGWTYEQYLDESPGREETCEHFVALAERSEGPRVVGTAMLLASGSDGLSSPGAAKPEGRFGKVLQVAVDRQMHGQGVGRKLMVAIEARAFAPEDAGGLGLDGLYCHAQHTAIGFYDRLGWATESDAFEEAGIVHRRMGIRAGGEAS